MNDYPRSIAPVGHIEPVARRIRGVLNGQSVFDTTRANYIWDWPHDPQYYIPIADVTPGPLFGSSNEAVLNAGPHRCGLRAGTVTRPDCARIYPADSEDVRWGSVRFDWEALDAWFEEDEEVFKHPRSPYARADALRSARPVRVELGGVTLAQTTSPIMVFETGLPTRYYFNRTEVRFEHLTLSDTVSSCPYKGKRVNVGT